MARIYVISLAVLAVIAYVSGAPKYPKLEGRERQYEIAKRNSRVVELNGRNSRRLTTPLALDTFEDIEDAIYNYPLSDARYGTDHLEEGDIMIPSEGTLRGGNKRSTRKIVNDVRYNRWVDNVVPWKIVPGEFGAEESYVHDKVKIAVAEWEARSCLTFPEVGVDISEAAVPNSYLEIINGSGCWSYVGNAYSPTQALSLKMTSRTSGCVFHGTIMHEFGHAMGFPHEQARADRDSEAVILYESISPSKEHNFRKKGKGESLSFDGRAPYDASSVMHYGLSGFSVNGAKTISMRDPNLNSLTGNRVRASFYDEVSLNLGYGCSGSCTDDCQNDGYVRQTSNGCQCICLDYITGPKCENVVSHPTCGPGIFNLASDETELIYSSNYPQDYTRADCAYLFHAPDNHHVEFELLEMDLPGGCEHALDVRMNAIGQPAYQLLCGNGSLEKMTTIKAQQKDKILVVFEGSDTSQTASGHYSFRVTARPDACINDPCHGAKCVSDGNQGYICDFNDMGLHCNFERGLMGPCSSLQPNLHYEETVSIGLRWDNDDGGESHAAPPVEGSFYWSAISQWNSDGNQLGRMSIIPTNVGGSTWCLDFNHVVYGSATGTLSVYRAVNGVLGSSLYTETGTSRQIWQRTTLNIDGSQFSDQDMIEVVFEAAHFQPYTSKGLIGIDDIWLTPGQCQEGPCSTHPCGLHDCVEEGNDYTCVRPNMDLMCGFELGENMCNLLIDLDVRGDDDTDMVYNTGSTPSSSTGPDQAHGGVAYIYMEATTGSTGDTAMVRVQPFIGSRIFSFWYNAYGAGMGSMNLYQRVNGSSKTLISNIFNGAIGSSWNHFEITIDATGLGKTDEIELLIEAVRGTSFTSDIALDDISLMLIPTS